MGTHQNGPAHFYNEPCESLLSQTNLHPDHYLGAAFNLKTWPDTTQIPFLFKILSIAKALPLQVHPDKDLAKVLHAEDPKTFVDSNHKPEIAVAIGEPIEDGSWGEGVSFTGFIGFQPLERIAENLKTVHELRHAIGNDALVNEFVADPSKTLLKQLYTSLLAQSQGKVKPHVQSLVERIKTGDWHPECFHAEIARLVTKVDAQYPGDVGVLATVFFMNFFKLKRGEAIYIGADEIHAYLEGDIIECMAVSDNVLNTAFVPPEERQVKAFVHALTFTARDVDYWRLQHKQYEGSETGLTQVYTPPFDEFVVLGTSLTEGGKETLDAVKGPTIGIVTNGKVKFNVGDEEEELDAGGIIFVAPGHKVHVDQLVKESEVWWAASMI